MASENANIPRLSILWEQVLTRALPPMTFEGQVIPVTALAAAEGFLPMWLLEADMIWNKVTSKQIGLVLNEEPGTALGVTVREPLAMPMSGLLACMTFAAESAGGENSPTIAIDSMVARFESEYQRYLPLDVGFDFAAVIARAPR